MSSYIIAGSADNVDTAYCEQVANKIKAKYSNIDFRIIIKHPSEWEEHIQEVCRIYGFRNKSNPIIYTFDGKIIGDKPSFLRMCNKYFGVTEKEMTIGVVGTEVNEKIAEQELGKKKKIQKGQLTLAEIVDQQLASKFKQGLFKYRMAKYDKHIQQGLVFYLRQVDEMVPRMEFEVQKNRPVTTEEIQEGEIDLAAIALEDQIPIIEQPKSNSLTEKEKDPFLTHQQEDKRSRTNGSQRMQDSVHSRSSHISQQGLKRQSVREKTLTHKAEEPVLDYAMIDVDDYVVTCMEDEYYLIFDAKPVVLGSMKLIRSAPSEDGLFQMDYSKHPRKQTGHLFSNNPIRITTVTGEDDRADAVSESGQNREIEKLQSQNDIQPNPDRQPVSPEKAGQDGILQESSQPANDLKQTGDGQKHQEKSNLLEVNQPLGSSMNQFANKKLRTEVDVREFQENKRKMRKGSLMPLEHDNIDHPEDDVDFAPEALEIDENCLDFMRPWTDLEMQKAFDIVGRTDGIATVQFKPENPNPVIRINIRKHLNAATANIPNKQSPLPIQKIILESIEEGEPIQPSSPIVVIRKLMFAHVIARVTSAQTVMDLCAEMLRFILRLQSKIERLIGYNIILAKQYLMVVPLINNYEKYNQQKLYLDGLAALGVVNIPKLHSAFSIQKAVLKEPFEYLLSSAGGVDSLQDLIQS